jgi:hypothetical protein
MRFSGPERTRNTAIRMLQGDGLLLYALRLPNGNIKIGCSSDVAERIRHIRHTEILALHRAERSDELAIHHLLRPDVVKGREIYAPTPAVLAVVNGMRAVMGAEPLAA